jgi:hypothetical protein
MNNNVNENNDAVKAGCVEDANAVIPGGVLDKVVNNAGQDIDDEAIVGDENEDDDKNDENEDNDKNNSNNFQHDMDLQYGPRSNQYDLRP